MTTKSTIIWDVMLCSSVKIHPFQRKMLPPSSGWQFVPPNVSQPLQDYMVVHSTRWYSSKMFKRFRNSGKISIFHTLQESTIGPISESC
jgi:hypothetical protein